jgi:hypothetical protein
MKKKKGGYKKIVYPLRPLRITNCATANKPATANTASKPGISGCDVGLDVGEDAAVVGVPVGLTGGTVIPGDPVGVAPGEADGVTSDVAVGVGVITPPLPPPPLPPEGGASVGVGVGVGLGPSPSVNVSSPSTSPDIGSRFSSAVFHVPENTAFSISSAVPVLTRQVFVTSLVKFSVSVLVVSLYSINLYT